MPFIARLLLFFFFFSFSLLAAAAAAAHRSVHPKGAPLFYLKMKRERERERERKREERPRCGLMDSFWKLKTARIPLTFFSSSFLLLLLLLFSVLPVQIGNHRHATRK